MTPDISCVYCGRLINTKGTPKCEAFPGRIPWEIVAGQIDHTKPFRGDHGLVFIPRRKPEPKP